MSYRTIYRPASLSDYRLGLWSRRTRKRQKYLCLLCLETIKSRSQAHHIYAKALYPEFAYCDWNCACIHAHHHQSIIHTTWTSWQDYVGFFQQRLEEIHGIIRP